MKLLEHIRAKWVKKGKSGYQNDVSHFPFTAERQVLIYCGFKLR